MSKMEKIREMCEAKECDEYAVEEGIIKLCEKHRYLLSGQRLKEAKDVER